MINKLRAAMKSNNISYYIIPSSDSHQSEYVADYFRGRAEVSGFTGSAGTVIVGMNEAYLWTDGRYFIQADKELSESGIKLMKMRTPGYPTIQEWVKENISKNEVLGFDGSVVSATEYDEYLQLSKDNGFDIKMDLDVVDSVWEGRPELPSEEVFIHDVKFAGISASEKITKVREEMKKLNAENYVLSSLDDIAWLFNLRGSDVSYNPVFLSYAIITLNEATLFVNAKKITSEVREYLTKEGINIKEYDEILKDVSGIDSSVVIDKNKVNALIYTSLNNVEVINSINITTKLKTIKNETEIKSIAKSQVRDGVAMVRFIKWVKDNVGKGKVTEISAAEKLYEIRAKGENFRGESFNTIAGYKDHAAMMHYSATESCQYELKPEGMFLVDSGGQYDDGTTDITRTIILGPITEEEKRDFTLVLRGHIALSRAKFLKGTNGTSLDMLARNPLWNEGIDYKCGTGHGLGFFLNVHEGPQGFRPEGNYTPFEIGMLTTNEPGVYKEGKHGIRTENTIIVEPYKKDDANGEFYQFRTVSFCPIDLDGVDVDMLNKEEKEWLNSYHKEVFAKLSPYLNDEELEFLKKETREV